MKESEALNIIEGILFEGDW